ncbi:hypothetical protein Tco_0215368 [Tanacetum coccineum]
MKLQTFLGEETGHLAAWPDQQAEWLEGFGHFLAKWLWARVLPICIFLDHGSSLFLHLGPWKLVLLTLFTLEMLPELDLDRDSSYVVPTGRVVVPTGRYVVPAGKVIIIVSPGRLSLVPTGRVLSPGRVK